MDEELENKRLAILSEEQARSRLEPEPAEVTAAAEPAASFGKKVLHHGWILAAAAVCDLIALVPFTSPVVNPLFGLCLFFYFGGKKKQGSELLQIAAPVVAGTFLDSITGFIPLLNLLPFNVGVALNRIRYA